MVSASSPKEVDNSDNKWIEEDTSRRAKWWYSTFHTVTAMIGAGVLSLPYAMAYLGWGPGTMVLALSWCMTLNTMWQMIQLHECVPGTRFDRYIDLGRHAFGPKLGPWIVLPQQLIVQVGCDIVYMVTGGKCLKKFMEMTCTNCTQLKQSYWILIFGAIHFFLSQLPNFNSVAGVSLAAAVMSLSYSTIAWAGCLSRGQISNVSYAYKKTSSADSVFRVFNALGQISFAFAGHAVALEIQATIPSTPEKPSKVPMWKGALGAYFINAICYFPVALIGYWAFGQDVDDNVLMNLQKPTWLIASANLMVVIHVIGSYQVYAMPVFALLERMMVKKVNFPPGILLRLITRSAYVAFTLFIGVTFPFFGDLLGFFGGYMADPSAKEAATLSKSVQEMSINGSEPPEEYTVKDGSFGSIESSPPLGSIPIINISLFLPSSSHDDTKQVENELQKLRSALSSGGCFQAIGHGISSSFLDKVRGVAKQFFALPEEEKQKYSRAVNESEGYGSDRVVSEKQVLDWSYRLTLRVFPEDRRRLNLWPENPNDFGETLHEYATRTKSVVDLLYKAMAKSLDLEEESFSKQFGENTLMQARFNFYPPCSRPHLVLGVKPHTDRSGITVLLQDEQVEGLQIFIEDRWVRVPILPHALLVNLGDQMQIMSNGIFKSPMHRVVTNTERMRMSVAMFNEPQPDREIGPVECLIDEKRPRLYRNVKDYGTINYECFQKGQIALETVQI